jgi:hypothetical protein
MASTEHPAPCHCPDPASPAIVAAHARAEADLAVGLANLRAAVAGAKEWKLSEKADGRTREVIPERAMLQGQLDRIEAIR